MSVVLVKRAGSAGPRFRVVERGPSVNGASSPGLWEVADFMDSGKLGWITNFIWGIADDVLRDLYVRGKYRDVILPMTVLRRLDAVLEPTKQNVLDMKASLDRAGITNQDAALRQAASQAFYNTSKFTLRDLRGRASQQSLRADFEAYLDGLCHRGFGQGQHRAVQAVQRQ